MHLRDYQQSALTAINDALANGKRAALAVLPTGSGKTVIFSHLAKRWTESGKRALILAHREELIWQAAGSIEKIFGTRPDVEMADYRADFTGLYTDSRVVVSSVQTLSRPGRLRRWNPADFGLVIVDECFVAGTLVDGRPIEEIKEGDCVKSWCHDASRYEMKRVTHVFKSQPSSLVTVITASGRRITCTPMHPFHVPEVGGYLPARDLAGQRCRADHGGDEQIIQVESAQSGPWVFNLEVEGNHNYFAEGILVHNCHHAVPKNASYYSVLEHFRGNPDTRVLGVTATPDRADEEALGQIFDCVAYEYSIQDAIRDGWLVPIKQFFVTIESLDLSPLKKTGGDFTDSDLAGIVNRAAWEIAAGTLEKAGDKPTLVFVPGRRRGEGNDVSPMETVCAAFNSLRPGCAAFISGDPKETPRELRAELVAKFRQGELQVLISCGVFLEGFDAPNAAVIAMARPTCSRALYSQAIGRGTRPLAGIVDGPETPELRQAAIAASAKTHVLVLDYVGNSGKHKLDLVSTVDILGGKCSEAVVERAREIIEREKEPIDAQSALAQAEVELLAEKRAALARQHEQEARYKAKATINVQAVDPFDVLQILPGREPAWHRGRLATEKQVDYLRKLGVPIEPEMAFSRASQLIGTCIGRREQGLCTFKQARLLAKFGIPAGDMGFAEASAKITELLGR